MADDDTTGTPGTGSQSSTGAAASDGDDSAKVIEDLRKRQSGADKARDVAIAERDELRRQYEALLSGNSGGQSDDKGGKSEAAIRAEVQREYEAKLAEATSKVQGEALNARFPAARAKYPEVTDAAKLAELEVLLAPEAPAPKPIGNNPAGAGNGEAKRIEDMSLKELRNAVDAGAQDLLNPRS